MFGRLKDMFGGNSEEIKNALNNGASIIDVRSEAEYRGGHVAGSKNIPLQQLGSAMSKMPKDKPIVFCCASGARSGSATSSARKMGYDAYNGGPWTSVNGLLNNDQ